MSVSFAYKSRQKTRKNGRYSEMYKCEMCNKSLGDYYSLPSPHDEFCKKIGIDGLSLCEKCCDIITPQYEALRGGKELITLAKKELVVKYVETLVLNGFDIAPFLFKEDKPSSIEMLNFINERSIEILYKLYKL